MNTIRPSHLNPQSKGNLGKSFEAEFRATWLDRLGVPWNSSDWMTGITLLPIATRKWSARISSAMNRRARPNC